MLITLLTDFGDQEVYVAVMKGVIAQINPHVRTIDLTHQIPPQDIAAARFNLMNAYPYFPSGTIHLAVVDPGVGGTRRAIALQMGDNYLVGPDNGLFSGIFDQHPIGITVELTNPSYWRTGQPSATFHGRDLFAPVAAHLANGTPLTNLGQEIDPASLVRLPIAPAQPTASGWVGYVQYCDRFGNLITTVAADQLAGKTWVAQVKSHLIAQHQTYSDVPAGELLILIGSHGWVEIASNCGNAQSQLQLNWTDPIHILAEQTNR